MSISLESNRLSIAVQRIDQSVTPLELRQWLSVGDELALLDVREVGVHIRDGHILLGVSAPLSQFEVRIPVLVPRLQTRIVVYDSGRSQSSHLWLCRIR